MSLRELFKDMEINAIKFTFLFWQLQKKIGILGINIYQSINNELIK